MNDGNFTGAVQMGVGVFIRHSPVGGPAGMTERKRTLG